MSQFNFPGNSTTTSLLTAVSAANTAATAAATAQSTADTAVLDAAAALARGWGRVYYGARRRWRTRRQTPLHECDRILPEEVERRVVRWEALLPREASIAHV